VTSSGIAALLLPGGRTSHSMFKLKLVMVSDDLCDFPKNGELGDILKQGDLILWDEVPMQRCFGPEAFDNSMQDLMDNNWPNGGKTVVYGGDFHAEL